MTIVIFPEPDIPPIVIEEDYIKKFVKNYRLCQVNGDPS